MAEFAGASASVGGAAAGGAAPEAPLALPAPVCCVAIVGRANNPLYIKAFDGDFKALQLAVYTSLDVCDELLGDTRGLTPSAPTTATDAFLGLLCPVEDLLVYGYATNTRTKIIVAVRDAFAKDEAGLRGLMAKLHTLYVDAVCNPFSVIDERITSVRFDSAVADAVSALSR